MFFALARPEQMAGNMVNLENQALSGADESRLKMFKIKLSTKKNLKPLQDLCIDLVSKNIMLYSDPSYRIQPGKSLPATVRQRILNKLAHHSFWNENLNSESFAEARGLAIIQLIDHEVKHLEFSCLAHTKGEEFGDINLRLMDALCKKSSNLREFFASPLQFRARQPLCKQRLNNIVTHMRSLQILRIRDSVCDDACLDAFGQNLPNLVVLETAVINVTLAGVKSLQNLKKFKEFWFRFYSYLDSEFESLQRNLTGLCLKHLPQLAIVSYPVDGRAITLVDHEIPSDMTEPSMLEQIHVRGQLSPAKSQLLPSVRWLRLQGVDTGAARNLEWLFPFKKLEGLDLKYVTQPEDVIKILELVGGNLKNLHFHFGSGPRAGDLWETLNTKCPKLEELSIEAVEVLRTPRMRHFCLPIPLRVVRFSGSSCFSNDFMLPDGLLPEVMGLPFLTTVHFVSVLLQPDDVRQVAKMIEAGSICQQLKGFHIVLPMSPSVLIEACEELLKNVCAYAPKISNISFSAPRNEGSLSPALQIFINHLVKPFVTFSPPAVLYD